MDRDRAYIPQLQVQFIDSVALPVYRYVLDNNIIERFPFLYKNLLRLQLISELEIQEKYGWQVKINPVQYRKIIDNANNTTMKIKPDNKKKVSKSGVLYVLLSGFYIELTSPQMIGKVASYAADCVNIFLI